MDNAIFEVRQALAQADRPDWAVPSILSTANGLTPLLDNCASPGSADPGLQKHLEIHGSLTPVGVFVGRQHQLRQLRIMLENPAGPGPVMALITGLAGVGKSTLVSQTISRYGADYKATLVLSCQDYQDFGLLLKNLAEFLQGQGSPELLELTLSKSELSINVKIDHAIAALNVIGPFVIAIDNLETVQEDLSIRDPHLLLFLQKLLTNLQVGRVLVAGRYVVKDLLPEGKFSANLLHLRLDDLSPHEILHLLEWHPDLNRLSDTSKTELISKFGGLPYVYDLLSSRAAKVNLDSLLYDVQGRITVEHEQRTAKAWEQIQQEVVTFAALDSIVSRLTQPEKELLARLSIFPRPFPLQSLERGLGVNEDEWQPLLDWSLLHYDPKEGGRYQLHSLTKQYAGTLLNEADRVATQMLLAEWYEQYASNESYNLVDYLDAHDLFRAAGASQRASELVFKITEALHLSGLYDLLENLCTTILQDNNDKFSAAALHTLGILAYDQGNYEKARQLQTESLQLSKKLGDLKEEALAQQSLGILARQQGDYKDAHRLYTASLQLAKKLSDQGGQAKSLHELAVLARLQGDYKEARRLFTESLRIAERLGDREQQGITLHALGNLARLQGDYKDARRFNTESLRITESIGDRSGQAAALHSLGIVARETGEYEEARRLYTESLQIKERLNDLSGQAQSLCELGLLAEELGDYKEAHHFYTKSLQISKQSSDPYGQAIILSNLGALLRRVGKYEEARRFLTESLELSKRLSDPNGQGMALGELGIVTILQERDLRKALEYTIQAYVIFENLHSPNRNIALQTIQEIRAELGKTEFILLWRRFANGLPFPLL